MITMTKAEALKIQADHVAHYLGCYPDDGWVARLHALTSADKLADDVAYGVATINRHIPRGGAIEQLIAAKVRAESEAGGAA